MGSTAGTCLSEMLKLNADELKRLLIKVWFGVQQSGAADQAIDQWRVRLDACVKAT